MTVIAFDLGDTLVRGNVLVPGAREMLTAVQAMVDHQGAAPICILISDFTMPATPDEIPALKQQYYDLLQGFGLADLFQPLESHVTLSTEVGVLKPKKKVFRTAVDKVAPNLSFKRTMFLTENGQHVAAARKLGMKAVQLKMPGNPAGDIDDLASFIPIVRDWLQALP
jgi:hypothetical protein